MMEFMKSIEVAREALGEKRVHGDPYERNGTTVIPAASVRGGGGGGGGTDPEGEGGAGGGFGIDARPVGAYVIRDGEVSWTSAFDLNRVILGCQLLGLVAIFLTHLRLRRRH